MADNQIELIITAQDQATQVMQNIAGELGSLSRTISQFAGAATSGFAVFASAAALAGGAATKMALDYANAVEQQDRLVTNTGFQSRELQVLRKVIGDAGGDFGSFSAAISYFNRQLAQGNPLIRQLGLDTTSTSSAFFDLVEIVSRSNDVQTRSLVMQSLLGRGSKEMAADLKAVAESYDVSAQSMERAGSLMRDDLAPAARDLDKEMEDLGENWKGIWIQMQEAMVGPVGGMLKLINDLIDAKRKLESPDDPDTAWLRARLAAPGMMAAHGGAPPGMLAAHDFIDPLAGIKPPKEPTARGKRIEELMRVMRLARGEAERLLTVLEAIEDRAKAQQIMATLAANRPIEELLAGAAFQGEADLANMAKGMKLRGRGAGPGKIEVSDLVEQRTAVAGQMQAMLADWHEFVNELTSSAGVMNGVLTGVWNGLQGGFQQVATNLIGTAQTLRSAIGTIFRSLADQVLSELARIAAAQVFKFVLQLLGLVIPGGGALASGVSAGVGGGSFLLGPGVTAPVFPGNARQVTNVYEIHAINARDLVQSIQSGEFRRANDQVRYGASY